ncbi:ABC transporter permease [Mycolicibacterium thermoresistibile]|jgi:osmoprotectant transport system permease protein|uniref:ABC transporter permease n=2 Tax=Mycolicibacterium thermoresistibile TaxID=1797 RepID=G7CLS1_MYCT3|nr:ABC transporter permease [Mycolicibacterium thermoresistibile]EHI10874.1 ABC transporter permease [Mycolicibacterium thermoresistibile ATCC 19527]MCV7188361.1 ABC transporter permease [Mycolicibacterium thermoresistibile]GAT13443.1 ABC quaternary amine transporter, permease component [Mycolicibacterium thermoresistibile]SNW18383.1 ABC quaternary amine transporter, permease component [Mycolicibacterium thermoresistibile]
MDFIEFVRERWSVLSFLAYQHMSLVVQTLLLSTLLAVAVGVMLYRSTWGRSLGDSVTSLGLTVPSYALLGVLVGIFGVGVLPSVVLLTFFGFLPILRNVLVGLNGVDAGLVESARAMGMSRPATLLRLELPLAWPVIMTGVRISAQMLMGIAAIAAFALGPGLGGYIFSGISRMGGANATNSIIVATVGILLLAVILDAVLNLVTRLTTPRGIRV